jgi:hypothetical protein
VVTSALTPAAGQAVPARDRSIGLIVGQVVDGSSGRSIGGAIVTLSSTSRAVHSESAGPAAGAINQPRILTGADGRGDFGQGHDALEVRQSTTDAVITLSDRASELTGTVADARGQPASGHDLVVFGTESASWFPSSRRIASVRPGLEGRYTIRNLPAGEYFIVATDDIDDN